MSKLPTIVWVGEPEETLVPGEINAPRVLKRTRNGTVELCGLWRADGAVSSLGLQARVNRSPVRLANHVALPETLLLCTITFDDRTPEGFRSLSLRFCWNLTRGVCEDGVTRYVGWNRLWHPRAGRWERVVAAEYGVGPAVIYAYAEDVVAVGGARPAVRGFEILWAEAADAGL